MKLFQKRQKYNNIDKVPLFGKYTDPFDDRRGTGRSRPKSSIPSSVPSYMRSYDSNQLYYSWMGHSSVFLSIQGATVLIDPVFSQFTSPVPFLGPRRFPGNVPRPQDMPEIDFVLITHNHYDHLDRRTIRSLDNQVKAYIVPVGVGRNLRRFGVDEHKITELKWYEEYHSANLDIILLPSQHDSGRSPLDMNRSLWGSYLIKSNKYTIYDSGDGGFASHFEEIHEKYPEIDLAIMECGQYNEKWHAIHMFPEESVHAAKILDAKLTVPVHWGAYVLSDHAWDDPVKRFCRRAKELGVNYKVPKIYSCMRFN